MRPVDKKTAQVGGASVILAHWLTPPTLDHMRGRTRGRVEDQPVFSVRSSAGFSLTEVVRYIRAIQDLLALATGRGPALLWATLYLPRPDRGQPEISTNRSQEVHAYFQQRGSGDPDTKAVEAWEMVFTLADIPFEELLPRWWHVREQFQAPCNILIGARYTTEPYVETSVITAVAAAEAFHKALNEAPPISQEELDDLIRRAVDAMPDDRKDWIKAVIPRGHSLKQRLDQLAQRLPDSCRELLLPAPQVWARAASRARNDLSHSGKSSADAGSLYTVMRVTRAVVLINILVELGMPEDRILKALTDNRELSGACDLSQENLTP